MTVEDLAFGLFVLDSPIFIDHRTHWPLIPSQRKELYMAKARFLMSYQGSFK